MSWSLQHVRLTIEDAKTGEVVIIEQGEKARPKEEAKARADAKAKEEAKARADAKAKEEAKARADAKAKEEAKAKADAKAKEEAKARADAKAKAKADAKAKEEAGARAKADAKEKKDAKEEAKAKPRQARAKRRKAKGNRPLSWVAVDEGKGYTGFEAEVGAGRFVVVQARDTQWALFFQRPDVEPAHLGCYARLERAQARAEELHGAGWPESVSDKVDRELVQRACPAPVYEREKPSAPPASKAEDKPPPVEGIDDRDEGEDRPLPPPSAPPPKAGEVGKHDEEMMRSFRDVAMSVVLADEDDED